MPFKLIVSLFAFCLLSACGETVETEVPAIAQAVETQEEAATQARTEPDGCTKRCRKRAAGQYKMCIEDGGDAVDCRTKAGETSRACVSSRCGGTPTAPNTEIGEADICKAKCAKLRLGYQECVDAGGTEDDCRQKTGDAVRACMADC